VFIPTINGTYGTEGPGVDWNGRMERKLKGTRENVVAEDVRRREHMGNVCFHCSEPESDAQLKYKSPKRHRPCTQLRDYHDVYVIWDTSSDDSDES
jgi:hypothetical protein